jgi:hypothetical protein
MTKEQINKVLDWYQSTLFERLSKQKRKKLLREMERIVRYLDQVSQKDGSLLD